MFMDLDWPHQTLGKSLYSVFNMDSWKHVEDFKQVGSDRSNTMENYYRSHCIPFVDKLPLIIAYKYLWIWIGHTKMEGKHFIPFSKWIPGSICKIWNKLIVTVVLWKILMKSLFDLFDSLQLNIAW